MEPKDRRMIEYLPELRRIPLPRTPVNRAKDGEEALPLTWSSVAAGPGR
jgi:hypothetical protein